MIKPKRFSRLSIRQKIIAMTMVMCTLALVMVLGCLSIFDTIKFRENMAQETIALAKIVGSNSTATLVFGDSASAKEILSALHAKEHIVMAALFNEEKKLFVAYHRDKVTQNVPAVSSVRKNFSKRYLDVVEDIKMNEKSIGTIFIRTDLQELFSRRNNFILTGIGIYCLIAFFVFLLTSKFQELISVPIMYLADMTQTVSRKGDYALRARKFYDDEVGQLINGFNEMLAQIESKNEKLKNNLKITRSLRDEYNRARQKAEAATEAKSHFLANMSHEIRTPMNAIVGFSNLLQKTPLNEDQRKYTDVLQSSGQLLCSVINGILDFSKLESGEVTLEAIDFNLHYLIRDVLEIISVRINKATVETGIDMAKDVPRNLNGDPTKLRQILLNLISNALKFTSQGRIDVVVRKEQKQPDKGVLLRFIVKDTGIGIAQDKLKHIFQPFSQADTSTTRKYGGTGLGLSISKAIVQAMEGKIWVESTEGKGSEFIFTIVVNEGAPVVENEVYPLEIEDIAGLKVLIVDDNQISREILKNLCESLKMEIVAVEQSGFVALEELKKLDKQNNLPSLILSDIRMEGMSGLEMVEKIRANKRYANIKTISVSSEVYAGQAAKARAKGFDGYISKPFNNSELIRVIISVLGDKREGGSIVTRHMACELGCKGITILVVEDNKPNQMLMQEYSKELGCEVEFAENGQKAIEKLKEDHAYNLVLMDLHMPLMGGIEACAIIRKEVNKDIPILALTAAVLEEDRKDAETAGMNDFLTKPIDIEDMRKKIIKYGRNI